MQLVIKNIMTIIGITQRICSLLLILFISISCKSQNMRCGYPSVYDSISDSRVYTLVEEMPVFLSDDGDIAKYIARIYQDSTKVGLQFSIKLEFIINKNGELINPQILGKKENEYFEEEAEIIEIIKTSPQWRAGICENKKVSVLLQLRLRFVIDEKGHLR